MANVPTIGDILEEMTEDEIGAKEYDMDLVKRAQTTLWSESAAGLSHCSNCYDSVVKFLSEKTG